MPKSKIQKRDEAEARRIDYEARTANEQMALVRRRRGDCLKERDKLIELIEQGRSSAKLGKEKK